MARIAGTQEVIRKLRAMNAAALGLTVDERLKSLLLSRVLGRFDEGVDPNGSPWPGLLAATLARKKRNPHDAQPDRLLYGAGRLRRSIKVVSGVAQGLLASSTGLGFRIGITDPYVAKYGRLHNYGIGQDKRQFIGLGALDVVSVKAFLRRNVKSIANA